MAISKERLEELIKQEKDVFVLYDNNHIRKENTKEYNYEVDESDNFGDHIVLNNDYYGTTLRYTLQQLFETKEEAEWELEFGKGRVNRTEELNLKNWNELNEYYKESDYYVIRFVPNPFDVDIQYLFSVNLKNNRSIYICKEVDSSLSEVLYDELLTKQNYTEACRLIKKLFMGEE